MTRAAMLRRQAEGCLRLSDACSDPSTADHLRAMAADFFEEASTLEQQQGRRLERYLPQFGNKSRHAIGRT